MAGFEISLTNCNRDAQSREGTSPESNDVYESLRTECREPGEFLQA